MRRVVALILFSLLSLVAVQPAQCAEAPAVQEIIDQGDLFLEDDKVGFAIQAYRQAIKREPENAEAHQRLGRALSLTGDFEGALYEATRATQLNPESASAHATRGRILGMMHRYRESAAEEYTSLQLDPDNPSAYLTLGLALASLGHFDDAIGAIYQAIRLDPENVSAYVNMGAVLGRRGDYETAVEVYRKALELNPTSVSTRLGLGAALGKIGDIKGQIVEFQAAVELAPNSDNAHGKLGWALYKHGDLDGAFKEGWITNWLRLKKFGPQYLRMFTYVWAGVFLLFGAIFAIIFIGSKLTPQADEILIKSYFLTFFKDRPGRFAITNKRVVWIPEGISKWFGAKDVSIDRNEIREIQSSVAGNQGRMKFELTDGTTHEFTMPLFVYRNMKAQLDKLGERARLKLTGPWVVPKEVQEAMDAGFGATETGVIPGEPPAALSAAAAEGSAAVTEADEDEQRDTRTKWERIRRPTKVYTFVNGKLVEDESESDDAGGAEPVEAKKADEPGKLPAERSSPDSEQALSSEESKAAAESAEPSSKGPGESTEPDAAPAEPSEASKADAVSAESSSKDQGEQKADSESEEPSPEKPSPEKPEGPRLQGSEEPKP